MKRRVRIRYRRMDTASIHGQKIREFVPAPLDKLMRGRLDLRFRPDRVSQGDGNLIRYLVSDHTATGG
jgi:hypothetical protein